MGPSRMPWEADWAEPDHLEPGGAGERGRRRIKRVFPPRDSPGSGSMTRVVPDWLNQRHLVTARLATKRRPRFARLAPRRGRHCKRLEFSAGQRPRWSLHRGAFVSRGRQHRQSACWCHQRGDVLCGDYVLLRRHRLHGKALDDKVEPAVPFTGKMQDIGNDVVDRAVGRFRRAAVIAVGAKSKPVVRNPNMARNSASAPRPHPTTNAS